MQGAISLRFEPGLTVLKQKGIFELRSVVDLISDLLYPAPMRSNLLGPGKAQQAGLTFEVRGTTYRVKRDYVRGATHLSQLEPGTKNTFRETSHELPFIREVLIRSAQLPSQRVFRTLLVSRLSGALPSDDRSGVSSPQEVSRPEVSMPGNGGRQRLEGLRQELHTHQKLAQLNSRQDDQQAAVFSMDEQLMRLEGPRRGLAQLEQDYEEYKVFDPPGVLHAQVVGKLKAYTGNREKRLADLTALDEKGVSLDVTLAQISDRPLWQEQTMLIGTILAPAGFVAVGFFRDQKWLSALCWLAFFVGLGLVVFGFFVGRMRLEKRERLKKEIQGLEAERAGIEKRFEIETSVCQKFFTDVGNEDAEELLGMLERHAVLFAERTKRTQEWKELLQEVPEEKIKVERNNALKEIADIEKRLSDLPPVTGDLNSVQREISTMEEGLRGKGEVSHSFRPDLLALNEPSRLVRLTAELIRQSERDLLVSARQGLESNLARISNGQVRKMDIAQEEIVGFERADGVNVSWEELDSDQKAAVLFSIQFTFWQLGCVKGEPRPVVLDLVSALATAKELRKISLQAAEFLSKKTQVLILGG